MDRPGTQYYFNPAQSADCLRELWRLDPDQHIRAQTLYVALKKADPRIWDTMRYPAFRRCIRVWAAVNWIDSPFLAGTPQGFSLERIKLTPLGRKRWNAPAVIRQAGINPDGSLMDHFLADPPNNRLQS